MKKRIKIEEYLCKRHKCETPKKKHFMLLENDWCGNCYGKKHKGFGLNKGGSFACKKKEPRKSSDLTEAQKVEIIALNKDKWINKKIADALNLPVAKVQKFLKDEVPDRYKAPGLHERNKPNLCGFDTFEELAEVVNKHIRAGLSTPKIAVEMGLPVNSVKSARGIMLKRGICVRVRNTPSKYEKG